MATCHEQTRQEIYKLKGTRCRNEVAHVQPERKVLSTHTRFLGNHSAIF